jgi:hypothetical protein
LKIKRALIIIGTAALILVTSNYLITGIPKLTYSQSYPPVVCPPTDLNVKAQVSIVSKNIPFRKIFGKSTVLSPIKTTQYSITKDAILLDQGEVSSLTWQSLPGVWAGATLCRAPQGDQWFVGGSADVTSKGRLYVVNSGLSDAIVDVMVWSQAGSQAGKVLTVRANSSVRVPLDLLATGASRLVIRVTVRSGRINAFLIDERVKGLKTLGGDSVNSINFPQTDLVLSGIPHQATKGKGGPHTLRILVPGNLDANIRVDSISKDGVFVPVGLDGMNIPHGQVVDIALTPTIAYSAFSLRIRSDQPIVAGVYTPLRMKDHQDIVWNSTSLQLVPMTMAVTGLSPTLVFTGDTIDIVVSTRLSKGGTKRSHITGSDAVIWKVPDGAQSISISDIKSQVAGGGLITSTSGVGAFPLAVGSVLAKAPVPVPDIAVINR